MHPITPEFIFQQMQQLGLTKTDLLHDLKADRTNIAAWVSGSRPMSKPVQAMFYWYFEAKKTK